MKTQQTASAGYRRALTPGRQEAPALAAAVFLGVEEDLEDEVLVPFKDTLVQ
ncbi:hypothetical protein [Streptomyces sp. S1]|uniref:hypothetical protein n=1 Tax=Streptomyces sp. S1 TaxID=718288 RepID=UPI003D716075